MTYKVTYEFFFELPEEYDEAMTYEEDNREMLKAGKTKKYESTIGNRYITTESFYFVKEKVKKDETN